MNHAGGPVRARRSAPLIGTAIAVSLLIAACLSAPSSQSPDATQPTASQTAGATLQSSPYPYTTPLPPAIASPLDGVYTKVDPKPGTPVPCVRCPDYAPEGGIWQLSFDKGVYRIFHTVTGWRSVGSFVISGNRLTLFNDPACSDVTGIYTWSLDNGQLVLSAVEDPCAIKLRAVNLTTQAWLSCQPPNTEAAVTDHWPKPPGCDTPE